MSQSYYQYQYTMEYMYLNSTSLLRDLNKFDSLGTSLGVSDQMKSILTDFIALSRLPSDVNLVKRLAVLRGVQTFCNDVQSTLTNLLFAAHGSATWIVPTVLDTTDTLVVQRVFPELSVVQEIVSAQKAAIIQKEVDAVDSFILKLNAFSAKYKRYYDTGTSDALLSTLEAIKIALLDYNIEEVRQLSLSVSQGLAKIRSSAKTNIPLMTGALNVMSIESSNTWSGLNLQGKVVEASKAAYMQEYEIIDILDVYKGHMNDCLQPYR